MSNLKPVPRRSAPELTPAELEERRGADLARVGRFLGRLQAAGFFGTVTVHLEQGRLTRLVTEQSQRVDDL